jgi:hypothetical protein
MKPILTTLRLIALLTGMMFFLGNVAKAAGPYYSHGNLDATLITSWGINLDGSGANPSTGTFTGSGTLFIIKSGDAMTQGAAWTFGNNLEIDNGGSLTTSSTLANIFTLNGTLSLLGLLTVSGAGAKNFGGAITINNLGVLSIDNTSDLIIMNSNVTVLPGGTFKHHVNYVSSNYLQMNGNLSITGTGKYDYAGFAPSIWMNGSGTHTINTGTTSLYYLLLRTGNLYANGPVTVDGNLYASWNDPSGSFHTAGKTVLVKGLLANAGGILYIDGGSLTINNAQGLLAGSSIGGGNGNVIMSSGTLATPAISMGLIGSYTATFSQSGGTITTSGLTVGSGCTFIDTAGILTINGDLNLGYASSNFNCSVGASTVTITGNLNNSGVYSTSTGSNTLNIGGNFTNSKTFTTTSASTVNFNGAGNSALTGSASTTFNNLTINKNTSAATVTNSSSDIAFNVSNDLTVTTGNLTLAATNTDYTFSNNVTVATNGILTHSVDWNATNKKIGIGGNLNITGIFNPTIRSHVQLNGSGLHTLQTGSNASSTLSILTLLYGNFSASGTLKNNQEAWVMFGSTGSFTTAGNNVTFTGLYNNQGTINVNTGGSLTVNGPTQIGYSGSTGAMNVSAGTVNLNGDITISASGTVVCTNSPQINAAANWIKDGAFSAASSTVSFTGSSNQTIGGASATIFNNLTISPLTGVIVSPVTNNVSVVSDLTVSSGIFDLGLLSCNRTSPGGTFSLASGAKLKLANNTGGQTGSNYPLNFATNTLNATSTVTYNGSNSITQTIFGTTYCNLTLVNGTGTGTTALKITTASVTAAGTTTVNALCRLTLGNTFNTGLAFNVSNNAELYCGSNVLSGAGSFNLNQGGTLGIGSNAGIAASGVAGNIQNGGSRTFNNDANYIYNGTANQSTGSGLNNTSGTSGTNGVRTLTINNTGTSPTNIVYLSADVQANSDLNMMQGIFNVGTGNTLYIRNTMSKTSGLIDETDGSLNMNGSTAQNISGGIFTNKTVNNLVISNTAAGTVLTLGGTTADSLKIKNLLSFSGVTGKTFATGDNLTILSTANYTGSVGDLTGNIISGKASVERYINTGTGTGEHGKTWQLLSTPTVGQSVYNSWQEAGSTAPGRGAWLTGPSGTTGFDAVTVGASLKYYNSATDQYTGVTNTAATITSPNGYFVFIRGDRSVKSPANTAVPTILRTTGTLYQPSAPAPSVIVPAGKYASVGNPFACQIDISYMKNNGYFNNLNNDVIVWDPSLAGSYNAGIFQTLSATNNYVPTAGSPSSVYPAGVPCHYIQSGQAFFVHTATGAVTNGTVSFAENIKYTSGSLLVSGVGGGGRVDRQYFRASLHNSSGYILDGNAVAFDEGFTNAVNADDALKITNSGENFSIKRGGVSLAVEAHALVGATDTIFYQLQNLKKQDYQLRFGPENMHRDVRTTLIDKFLNRASLLSNTDSSIVNFSVTADATSSAPDRFMVVFMPQNILPVKITSIAANRSPDKTIKVQWQVENELNIQQYVVERSTDQINFTSIGAQLPGNNKGGVFSYSFTDAGTGNNIDYFYRIKSKDIYTRISYSDIASVAGLYTGSSITVFPNPVVDKTINLQFTGQPQSNYHLQLISQSGQVVYEGSIESGAGNFTKIIYLHRYIQAGVYQLIIINSKKEKVINKVMIN